MNFKFYNKTDYYKLKWILIVSILGYFYLKNKIYTQLLVNFLLINSLMAVNKEVLG
jgi:hypothetical protein